MALTLTIRHMIHLTKEQRYALHGGEAIETIGCSLPVWFDHDISSEPAREVFCNYYLSNVKQEIPIKILENGYEIVLPYKEHPKRRDLTNEEWRTMSEEQLEVYYKLNGYAVTSESLLDVADGGSECLMYREHNKVKFNNKMLAIVHFVSIEDMDYLHRTMQF